MRPQKVLEEDILTGLTKVFRSKGFEGASLNDLAEATGLKKASLYHRFPDGKEEMAKAVFDYVGHWVDANVFNALTNEDNPPDVRLKIGLDHIRTLYEGGRERCVFRAFSMKVGLDLFEQQVSNGMKRWIDVFFKVGQALGQQASDADENARQTLIEIQGSLVVSKGLGDLSIFNATINRIQKRYLPD